MGCNSPCHMSHHTCDMANESHVSMLCGVKMTCHTIKSEGLTGLVGGIRILQIDLYMD